jgi:hypothetical protein
MNGQYFRGKVYYFKIWSGGTLIHDLIPIYNYRKVGSYYGFYDLVTKTTYTAFTRETSSSPTGIPLVSTVYQLSGSSTTTPGSFEPKVYTVVRNSNTVDILKDNSGTVM